MKRTAFLALQLAIAGLSLSSAAFAGGPPSAVGMGSSGNSPLFLHRVSLVNPPDRECVRHYEKRVGMSPRTFFRKYGATGQIQCPSKESPRVTDVSTGNFACGSDVVVTALHTFVDYDTGKIRHRPDECRIVLTGPDGRKMKPIPLTDEMIGGVDIFREGLTDAERKQMLDSHPMMDWAVVRTKRHAHITPYTVFDKNALVESGGDNLRLISASGPQADMQDYGCRTISVYCSAVDAYAPNNVPDTWPREVLTDCDINHGASGGADLQKVAGRMTLIGIHSEDDSPGGRGSTPGWYEDIPENNYKAHHNDSRTILVERDFLKALTRMCGAENIAHLPAGNPYDETTDSEPPTIGHR
jgi:hypothetical protein